LALTQLDAASAKEISKFSNVARETVYRVLPRLQKLCLVEKEIAWPTRFSAVTLDDAVTVLLGRRNKESLDLKEKVKLLLRLNSKQAKKEQLKEKFEFILVPAKKRLISKLEDAIDRAQKCICILNSNERLLGAVEIFSAAIEKALSRGIKIQIVISKSERVYLPAILEFGNTNFRIEVKYALSDPKCAATIIDKKEVLIITKPSVERCGESPALWSNNSSLVNIVEDYFEILWMTSLEKQVQRQR
jgi:sugar-specific transcriptional regulator TrmB